MAKEKKTRATLRQEKAIEDTVDKVGTVDDVVTLAPKGAGTMLDDLKWVFNHLNMVSIKDDEGRRRPNLNLLVEAPSDAARSFLIYAYDDVSRFVEKFAPRLLPKDEAPKEVSAAEHEKLTDPALGTLRDYLVVMETTAQE